MYEPRILCVFCHIAKVDLKVEWCPTGDMVGDYMTKPLQGPLFCKFRDIIMGVISTKCKTKPYFAF